MKSLNQLLSDWRKAKERMEKLNSDLPRIIGAESVKVVKQNFHLSGYDTGSGVTGWPERSEKTNKAYDRRSGVKGSVYNSSNPLLIQTHNLYNSIKYIASKGLVLIGVNLNVVPYAKKMNEGGNGTPARKFIPANSEPPNQKILKRIVKKIGRERDNALKDFKK